MLTLFAMSLVFIVQACESRDTGLLASAACGLQKSMERLARLQAYDS